VDALFEEADAVLTAYHENEELAVFKRGRNAKSVSVPKSCTPSQYRRATGFESLMGWLYLNGREDRIKELLEYGIKKYTESKQ